MLVCREEFVACARVRAVQHHGARLVLKMIAVESIWALDIALSGINFAIMPGI